MGRLSARAVVATLVSLLVFQAGAVAPALVFAQDPSISPAPSPAPGSTPTPGPTSSPTPAPSPQPTSSPEPTSAPAPDGSPTPDGSPAPEPSEPPTEPTPSPVEREDLRTVNSQTYVQADGTYLTDYYFADVFYQPEGRTDWQPIDTTLRPAAEGTDLVATVDQSPARLELSASGAGDHFLALHGDDRSIAFGLPSELAAGRPESVPVVLGDGQYAEYPDFLPEGIALRVFPNSDGVKRSWSSRRGHRPTSSFS